MIGCKDEIITTLTINWSRVNTALHRAKEASDFCKGHVRKMGFVPFPESTL